MYKNYFGIEEKPFSITPDPRYLLLTQGHEEALAHLLYGIGDGGGFVLLTGEVGTGKTSVCRRLLELLDDTVHCALVLNPHLNELDLAAVICDELGVQYPAGTSSLRVLVDSLNQHLLALHGRGERAVVLIDEAQNLSRSVLEQLRLLTNLETEKQKLLQIILVGQPELNDLLRRRDLRQVAQRITARYHLMPLKAAETSAYISHRLQVAGVPPSLFSKPAVSLIHKLSGGVPRLINLICDRAMLGAYVQERRVIDRALTRGAARQVFGPGGPQPTSGKFGRGGQIAALAAAVLVLAVGGLWFAKGPGIDQWLRQELNWVLQAPWLDPADSEAAPAGDAAAGAASTESMPTEATLGEAVPAPIDDAVAAAPTETAPSETTASEAALGEAVPAPIGDAVAAAPTETTPSEAVPAEETREAVASNAPAAGASSAGAPPSAPPSAPPEAAARPAPAAISPAPASPAPVTAAPVPSAPVTAAPVTPAPVTAAPVTAAPVTAAPVTPAPVTAAPVTAAPVTAAPVTAAPVTPALVTPAPVTPAPVTPAPVTPAPVTPAPVTAALVSPAPVTPAPVTPAPVTPAPVTPAARADGDAPTVADRATRPEVAADLAAALRNTTALGSRETARRSLFALWASNDPPTDETAACDPARNGGLSCLWGSDGWRGVETFDRPALIALRGPEGEVLSATLLSLAGDRVTLEIAGAELVASRQDVTALWTGDYLLLWRAAESTERLLAEGSKGTDVLWLRRTLAALLGRAAGPPDNPIFDAALTEAVIAFQRSRSLTSDGVVGPKTLVLLNNALGGDTVLRLRAK